MPSQGGPEDHEVILNLAKFVQPKHSHQSSYRTQPENTVPQSPTAAFELDQFESNMKEKSPIVEKYQNLPIIAMTAHAREEDKQQSLAAGMNLHMPKPVTGKVLFTSIKQILSELPS